MSTTIDSLQIEIQSNASGAKASLEGLAGALEKIKKSTVSSTAVKNLRELTSAMKALTPVASNAKKLGDLADSLSKLSTVGSLRAVTNQLKSLPEALRGLSGATIDSGLGSKVTSLVSALTPLSQVKSGGFASVVNSLAKIGKVTESLDDKTIERFTDRIKKLNEKLTPLSDKMTTIQAGLRGINSSARQASSGVQNFDNKINASRVNLASFVTIVQGAVAALQPLIRLFSSTISQALEWDGVSARFGRGFGNQANDVYSWIQRLNEEMGINIQQFMQYSSIFSTMLQGFGVGIEDSAKMALGYTELTYDIWAGYNDVYKNFADAADAVKSAIAGEVEPIRRAGFTIVESTLEQTAANHGLAVSLEKATEEQKSYLRYLTLVDQAYSQNLVGTYASELNTAEGLMRTFSQQLKSLSQAFGSLFLPILVKIMPYLSAFIELLTEAVHWLAALMGFKIQAVNWSSGFNSGARAAEGLSESAGGAADALDNATRAAKELKNATLGIDELNIISPPTESGGGGGGGAGGGAGGGFDGLDVDSLWDESIFKKVKSNIEDIKNTIKGFIDEFKTEIQIVGALLGALSVSKLLGHLGQALGLGEKFLGTMDTIAKLAVTGIIITIQYTLAAELFESFIDGDGFKNYIAGLFVSAIGTGILYSMWGPAGLVIGLAVTAAASLKAVIDNGGITNVESGVVALTGFAAAVGAVVKAWPLMKPVIEGIKEYAEAAKLMAPEVGVIAAWFPKLSSALAPITGAISGAVKAVAGFIGGLSSAALGAIVAAIAAVVAVVIFLKENWEAVTEAVKNFFKENIVPKLQDIKEHFEGLKENLSPLLDLLGWLIQPIAELIQGFKDWAAAAEPLKVLGEMFEFVGGVIFNSLTVHIAGAFNAVMSVIEGFVQFISGLVGIVSGVVEAIVRLFQGDLSGVLDAVEKIEKGIQDVFEGLYDMTIGAVVEFVEGVIDWFREMWDILVGHSIVPDTIDAIVEWFKSLPGKLLSFVGKFVTNIVDKFKNLGSDLTKKFSSAWTSVKNWWSNKQELSVPEVGVSLVKKGWKTVKDWIGKIPGIEQAVGLAKKGWSSIKNWIGSIPDVNQAVKLAKSGWSSVKNWVGTIPTLSAGIKLVKDGWSTVKKWLGNLNFDLGFKLPRIGVKWGERTVLGFKISYPSGFYTYAKGGFPDVGEMFIAREAGPEMVGKIGSRTTVANNEQIVEGISEGVYAAVLAAMKASESNGSQSVNVYLDGKQITSTVERRQRERGASVMGRQVFSY